MPWLTVPNGKLWRTARIGLVCCCWVSWWGGQLERRERRCFGGLHVSFVLSSAPLHLFSWHSWFCEALSASCFLFLTWLRLLIHTYPETYRQLCSRSPWCFLLALLQNKRSLSLYTFLFFIHQVPLQNKRSLSLCTFLFFIHQFPLFLLFSQV